MKETLPSYEAMMLAICSDIGLCQILPIKTLDSDYFLEE